MANDINPVTPLVNGTPVSSDNRLPVDYVAAGEYETIAASQTDQVLGATGAIGDYLQALLLVPASTSPGAVSIKDGSGSAMIVFAGGTDSIASLVPFRIELGMTSLSGAWKVTTGAALSLIGLGRFT